jgi:hypothetical protein
MGPTTDAAIGASIAGNFHAMAYYAEGLAREGAQEEQDSASPSSGFIGRSYFVEDSQRLFVAGVDRIEHIYKDASGQSLARKRTKLLVPPARKIEAIRTFKMKIVKMISQNDSKMFVDEIYWSQGERPRDTDDPGKFAA